MTHQQKIEALTAELRQRGIAEGAVATPVHRIAWKYGSKMPPPQCARFIDNLCMWGAVMSLGTLPLWVLLGIIRSQFWLVTLCCVGSGLFFGTGMAVVYSIQRKRLGLPCWKEYGKSA